MRSFRRFAACALLSTGAVAEAQHEVCPPTDTASLQQELGRAEKLLEDFHIDRARRGLEHVRGRLRCLEEPVPSGLIARMARGITLAAFYDQDTIELERWAGVALLLDPAGSWPAGATQDHPVHARLEDVAIPEQARLDHVGFALGGGASLFANGAPLAEPALARGVPHFVQHFDRSGSVLDAWWQDGPIFPDGLLEHGAGPVEPPKWWVKRAPPVEWAPIKGFKASKKDTVEAYAAYLREEPSGPHADLARARMDELAWRAIAGTDNERACQRYLDDYFKGAHRPEALACVERARFQAAYVNGSLQSLRDFVVQYPQSPMAVDATLLIDGLHFAQAVERDTPEAYAGYLLHLPDGRRRQEAWLRREQLLYEAADRSQRIEAYEAYLEAFPQGNFAEQARARVAAQHMDYLVVHLAVLSSFFETPAERAASVAAMDAQLDAVVLPAIRTLGFGAELGASWVRDGDEPPPAWHEGDGGTLVVEVHEGVNEAYAKLGHVTELRAALVLFAPGLSEPRTRIDVLAQTTALEAEGFDERHASAVEQLGRYLAAEVVGLKEWREAPPQ